jgi:hypothetical protein
MHLDQQHRDLVRMLDERFASQQEMVRTALTQQEKQVVQDRQAMEKRLDALNELRSLVSDQQRDFVSRAEYSATHSALAEKIDALTARVNEAGGGQAATYRVIGWGFAIFGVIMTLVVFGANYIFGH